MNEVTAEMALQIVEEREPRGSFWQRGENGMYVGIDNTTGNAWVEEFQTLAECERWLKGDDDEEISMKKFKVFGVVSVTVVTEVSAADEEEALSAAADEFQGISSFCGNGGTNKLIGVLNSTDSISCEDDTPEWDYAAEV